MVLVGCSGTSSNLVSRENLEKIEKGMTIAKVKAILGEPTQVLGSANTGHYIWLSRDRAYCINIGIKNGKVGIKQWVKKK